MTTNRLRLRLQTRPHLPPPTPDRPAGASRGPGEAAGGISGRGIAFGAAERRDAACGRPGAFAINNHRAGGASASRLPPGVPEGYAGRAMRRPRRWTEEDRLVYEHWRSGIPPVTAALLFLDAPGPLLVARGAGWEAEEDEGR